MRSILYFVFVVDTFENVKYKKCCQQKLSKAFIVN